MITTNRLKIGSFALAPVTIVALLSVCSTAPAAEGGHSTATSRSHASSGGWGDYARTADGGGTITVTLPAQDSNRQVRKLEAYRKKVGAPAVTYIAATLDDRHGKQELDVGGINQLAIVDQVGHTHVADEASDAVNDWTDLPNVSDNTSLANQGIDLSNSLMQGGPEGTALPGARSTTIFIVRGKLPTPEHVYVAKDELTKQSAD